MYSHSIRVQAAHSRGKHAAALYLDLCKFFDHVGHDKMQHAVTTCGFPNWLWRAMAASYTAPRCIRWQRRLGMLGRTEGTIIPGCALAAVAVKVLLLPLLTHLQGMSPQ
eukprot:2014042-Amphidinium_carterae.1